MSRIMIVDDEQGILNALQRSFRRMGWEVLTFTDPEEALNYAGEETIDLVISDYQMPMMNGVDFLKEFMAIQPYTFRIILSGQADMAGILNAINQAEIYRFITKPWHDDELAMTIEKALHHRETLLENKRLADLVRNQQLQIKTQKTALERLEQESPGITRVNWDADGSIIVNKEDYS